MEHYAAARHGEDKPMMVPSFIGDPFVIWQLPGFEVLDQEWLLPKLFSIIFSACVIYSGKFYEGDDYASCGIHVLPGRRIDDLWDAVKSGGIPVAAAIGWGPSNCIVITYPNAKKAAIRRILTKDEQKAHWYIYILATNHNRCREGLAGRILTEMKRKSQKDGRPTYVEATMVISRNVYLKHGFSLDEKSTFRQGKRQMDENGLPQQGGVGIPIWPMVWRPQM